MEVGGGALLAGGTAVVVVFSLSSLLAEGAAVWERKVERYCKYTEIEV